MEVQMQASEEKYRILHEINAGLLSNLWSDASYRTALERLHTLIPYQVASVSNIDLAQQYVHDILILTAGDAGLVESPRSAWPPFSERNAIFEIARQGKTHMVQDIATLETLSALELHLKSLGIHAYVTVPMIAKDALIGMLTVAADQPNFFRPDHVEILEEISTSLAVAMQQAKLLAQTQRDAEMKALLLQEVNHRVMNYMVMIASILEMEINHQRDAPENRRNTEDVLQDILQRIRTIDTMYRMLSLAQWGQLDPSEIISEITESVLRGLRMYDHITVVLEAPDDLGMTTYWRNPMALAMVINELTTNSVKYAFAGRAQGELRIQLEELETDDGEPAVRLVFRDDGPGFPEGVLAGERDSTGLRLIEACVTRTLSGEIAWHNDGGAVVEIQFPD
jgi:two-component sensor histidine kinase